MAIVVKSLGWLVRFTGNLFRLLLGVAIGLAVIALGVWRFNLIYGQIHHHGLHGSFARAVAALMGAMIIVTIGLVITFVAGFCGVSRLRRQN